ncbi:MAG: ABC transporter ATP-binding protein [Deltaproteobacteria bacterium]|jgi:spermidine/putrescine ABC transporter ATP-binding subunit|nr:ABC transporter ATP-binding protein [Deltaproteobacteria bacterium]
MTRSNNQAAYAVELINITKRFGKITAVNDISFAIPQGEIFALLGPSGCGKTTLLRMIAGFEKQNSGDIRIQGEVVNNIPPNKRECNLVFQQMALFPHMSVAANVAFGLVERKRPRPEIKQKVQEMLDVVNLVGMEERFPHQLSGGQKQRVALARSLALNPKVLLLDEPLAALDRKLRKEMQGELRRIQREVGITFLYVTHDQKVALSLSDRMGVMRDGKIMQIGTPLEIYETPQTRFVAGFIGSCNIFSGRVLSKNGNGMCFEDQYGHSLCVPDCQLTDTDQVRGISVHPEMIEILPPNMAESAENSDNLLRGKITDVFYQGDFTELTIKIPETDCRLTVHLSRSKDCRVPLKQGGDVVLRWDACHSNILRD